MKAILLAGGNGSRLYPSTSIISKQLLPIYSVPMIYFSISFLMKAGIKDIVVITNDFNVDPFKKFLGDGSQWGVTLTILPQEKPNGIAEAFIIAEDHIKGEDCLLLLGDNIFYGYHQLGKDIKEFSGGASIYGYHVHDPERYGVIEFDDNGNVVSLEEKPEKPKSHYASVGLYMCDDTVVDRAKNLVPSARGELEITDLLKTYLEEDNLKSTCFKRDVVWLDAGTTESFTEASNFIEAIEKRSGCMVASPEEIALSCGFIDLDKFKDTVMILPSCSYKDYLTSLLVEHTTC